MATCQVTLLSRYGGVTRLLSREDSSKELYQPCMQTVRGETSRSVGSYCYVAPGSHTLTVMLVNNELIILIVQHLFVHVTARAQLYFTTWYLPSGSNTWYKLSPLRAHKIVTKVKVLSSHYCWLPAAWVPRPATCFEPKRCGSYNTQSKHLAKQYPGRPWVLNCLKECIQDIPYMGQALHNIHGYQHISHHWPTEDTRWHCS